MKLPNSNPRPTKQSLAISPPGFDKVLKSAGQVSNINGLSVNLKSGYLSIGTAQAQGIAARLQQAGLNDIQGQAIQGLVRSLGKTKSKAAKTEIAEKIIKGAEAEKDTWEAGNEIADNPQTLEQKAELAATVLDLFGVTAPSTVLENGQAGAQIIISLGTSAVSYNRINQPSNLTSMKLAALKTLTSTLVKRTDALRASNTSQQNCLQLASIPKQQPNLNPKPVIGKSAVTISRLQHTMRRFKRQSLRRRLSFMLRKRLPSP